MLVELLLVISIISLISSVALVNLQTARAKARDAHKKVEVNSVKSALELFRQTKHTMPQNHFGSQIAVEDMSNPTNPQTASGQAYKASMQELVDAGVLAGIPHSPGGDPYAYYNYGPGTKAGAVFFTSLERENSNPNICLAPATAGLTNCILAAPYTCNVSYSNGTSCSWDYDVNWQQVNYQCTGPTTNPCSLSSSSEFCTCTPY